MSTKVVQNKIFYSMGLEMDAVINVEFLFFNYKIIKEVNKIQKFIYRKIIFLVHLFCVIFKMPVVCNVTNCEKPAVLKRPKTGDPMCKECFFFCFEEEIHFTIVQGKLFKRGDRVAIGASGGKDSTVLAYVLKLLNEQYDYGLDLFLLSIDEGISGYRDDSLETVKQNRDDYKLPLKILSYKDLYGWTMDEIVAQIGRKNNCTFCGVFRRQALDRGAALLGADMIVTGHNADDIAETVIMNVLRGDIARLSRCTLLITEGEGTIPRCKPLKYTYEKEIVMYAHYKELVYFSTECIYSPNAYRGHTREYIKEVEKVRPSCILDIIHSGETVQVNKSVKFPARRFCTRCGFVASQEICKACVLLEGLNIGMPKLGIGKTNKAKKIMGLEVPDGSENKSKKKPKQKATSESKRKIKRDNKRKSCRDQEGCTSSCMSEIPEPSTSKKDDSVLETSETNPYDEENACGSTIDFPLPSTFVLSSDDEDEPIELIEKKEIVECKCPPHLRVDPTIDPTVDPSTEDDSSTYSEDEIIDIAAFKTIMIAQHPEILDEIKKATEEFESLSLDNPDHTGATQTPTSTVEESKNITSETQPSPKDITNETQPSSYTIKETENPDSHSKDLSCNATKLQSSSSIVTQCADSETQLPSHSNNTEEPSDDQPSVVKATPQRIRPSLMLPEMMYKAKNNLDF